ncbi:hypothetical protein SAMN04487894_103185 [Niabella drilacis]|uniref:Uncharacterized protein n=1 Tax=Niabella drilacis (strain DSM 25811 / CCM 8410 / CCUG 62505 / LMG 26954 / E90) TaxID=1285928 RepID=A0A1G6N7P1_NIADE|nr:hypothetical protein SAMN04487894_103185 [Niabella drilacis]
MGNKISHHNINYYFVDIKIIYYKFYSHFKMACGYVGRSLQQILPAANTPLSRCTIISVYNESLKY